MNSRSLTDIVPRIDFAWWETTVMRAGFAILLLERFPPLSALPAHGARLSFPNGLAKWVDLTWALDPAAYSLVTIFLETAAALYILGFAFPVFATILFLCYLVVGTPPGFGRSLLRSVRRPGRALRPRCIRSPLVSLCRFWRETTPFVR